MSTPSASPQPSSFRTGPKMAESGTSRFLGNESTELEKPTWRGWVLGFFFVAVLCMVIPYVDFVLHGTMFSNSMFPTSSTFFLFVLIALVTLTLTYLRSHLGLTRQDLALCFCMSLAANAIPGCGFWAFWQPTVMGGTYFATADNGWNETIVPHIPADWQAGTENERNFFEHRMNSREPKHAWKMQG